MNLNTHHRVGKNLFWVAQAVGVVTAVILVLFVGGNLIGELIQKSIDVREDYMVFVFFLCELCILISFKISWRRKRLGPILVLLFTTVICILWGRETINIIWFHSPLVFSGLLLLIYSYYKEWILKRKM